MIYRYFLSLTLIATFTCSIVQARMNRFAEVAPGIYRGSQPETASDYEILKALHIRTIINLRTEKKLVAKERREANSRNIDLYPIPLSAVTQPSDESIDRAIVALENPDLKPIFVHCQLGRDRTGLVIGLYRVLQEKWTPNRAFAEMRKFGFNPLLLGLNYYFRNRTGFWRPATR